MRRKLAAVGSSAFFALGPGMVAGVIPWKLTRGRVGLSLPGGMPVRVAGGVLVAGGAAVLIHAFARFVVEGLGTPAPVAPPQHLVTGGLYRRVRNPMYLAVGAAIVGQAALFGQPVLLLYAAGVTVIVVAFVRYYEEPTLARTFGAEYEEYRRNVPAWWPSLRPWRGPVVAS
jgi:protein-S-isoprenylcysteine O-methyltransferase Ste14